MELSERGRSTPPLLAIFQVVGALLYMLYDLIGRTLVLFPEPLLLAGTIGLVLFWSVNASTVARKTVARIAWMQSVYSWSENAANTMTSWFADRVTGRDTMFVLLYFTYAVIAVITLLVFCIGQGVIPWWAMFGTLISAFGVAISVIIQTAFEGNDAEQDGGGNGNDTEEDSRRRMYLHGATGASVAVAVIGMQFMATS